MKQKHIDAAREARLWVAQIITPLTALLLVPEVREALKAKTEELKNRMK